MLTEAERLVGHPLEFEQTADGKWIVLWMRFGVSPPPKADTTEEAARLFTEYIRQVKGTENTDESRDRSERGSLEGL